MALFQCCSFRWIKNLMMKTQVFLFQVLMVTLIGIIFGGLLWIHYQILDGLIQDISNHLLQKIHLQALHAESNQLKLQSLRNFQNNIIELDKMNQFNHLAQNLQDLEFSGEQRNQCPSFLEVNVSMEYSYQNIPQFCYAFFNSNDPWKVPKNQEMKELFLFFNLLNTQIFRLDKSDKELCYISHKSDVQFFAMNPYARYISNYKPQSRPWYQSHIKYIENATTQSIIYKFSDSYENYVTGELQITATTSLTGLNGEFQGVLAIDFLLKEILQIQTSNVDSLFLDINGRVIQSNTQLNFPDIEFANKTYYIYDQAYSGFDEDDWLQIQQEAIQKTTGKSNCVNVLSVFCRNNQFYEQDLIIEVIPILNKFYLIMQLYIPDFSFVEAKFLKDNEQLTLQIEQEFFNQMTIYGIIFVITSCILIFVTWVLLSFFLHPYNQLKNMTLESIKQNESPNSYNKPIKEVYRRIGLQNFESKIFRMKSTRSVECKNIEKFKYPKMTVEIPEEWRAEFNLIQDVGNVFIQEFQYFRQFAQTNHNKIIQFLEFTGRLKKSLLKYKRNIFMDWTKTMKYLLINYILIHSIYHNQIVINLIKPTSYTFLFQYQTKQLNLYKMIVSSLQCLKSLTIKTQVFCFQLLVISIICLIFGICILINYKLLKGLIIEIQDKIFEDMQIQRLNSQTNNIYLYSQQYFINGYNYMDRINRLYQFTLNTSNLSIKDQSFHCPLNLAVDSNYSFKLFPYFCYAYFNSIDPFDIQNDKENQLLMQLLNQQLLRIGSSDEQVQAYFSHKNETQFFAITPFIEYQSEYRPHIRPWYLNHLEQIVISNKSFHISDIYLDYITKDQLITITSSLEDTNKEFQGVIAVDFTVESMQLLNYRDGMLLTTDGQIIQQSPYFLSKVNDFIYETQYTGFTIQDWEEIQKQILLKNGVSNCKTNSYSFCRNNKYFNQDLILDVFNLFDKFYLIMQCFIILSFVDVKYLEENQQFISNLYDQFFISLVIQFIIFLIISVILLAVTWFLMSFFLHPYTQLNQHTLDSLYQSNIVKNIQKTKDIYRQINLQNFTAKLSQMKNTRSKECQILEKFVYPKQTIKLTEQVYDKFEQLENLEANINYLSIFFQISNQVENKIEFIPSQTLIEEFKLLKQQN